MSARAAGDVRGEQRRAAAARQRRRRPRHGGGGGGGESGPGPSATTAAMATVGERRSLPSPEAMLGQPWSHWVDAAKLHGNDGEQSAPPRSPGRSGAPGPGATRAGHRSGSASPGSLGGDAPLGEICASPGAGTLLSGMVGTLRGESVRGRVECVFPATPLSPGWILGALVRGSV